MARYGDGARLRTVIGVVVVLAAALIGITNDTGRGPAGHPTRMSDVDAARERARQTGQPQPIPSATTETAEYTALPTGELRLTLSAGVVRVRHGGGWVPLDLTLRHDRDGSVAAVAHANHLRLSGARPAGTHEVAAIGAGPGRIALAWTGALPRPVLDGPRATYPDALPGVDLVVTATARGFAQTLLVKDRTAVDRVAAVPLSLTGPGITGHTRDAAGNLTLTGKSGPLATVPALSMWDARVDPAGAPTRTAPIASTVDSVPGGVRLTLTPDLGWLRDPATAFPVTLDPTVNPVTPTFDTWIRQGDTIDRSAATDLHVGLLATSPPVLNRALLTWDASMLVGKQITSATVSFFSFWSHTCDPRGWKIWTTGEVSAATRWDTQPPLLHEEAESTATTGGTNCADGWVSIDGTSFFRRAATAGAAMAHMTVTASNEADVSGFKQFRSRNSTQVPYASVTYNTYPQVTAQTTNPATTCVTGSGRPDLTTLTPTLGATVSDPEGTAMSVRFEWRTLDGTTDVGSATVNGVASGAGASVPAALPQAGSYRWRVVASDGTGSTTSGWCEFTVAEFAPPAEGCAGVEGDIDGDGVADVVIADPRATVDGQAVAGAVYVTSGATGAVSVVHQNLAEVPDTAEAGDNFGFAVAVYDANRDGCADVAVGAPYENSTGVDTGLAVVLLGSPAGLGKGPAAVPLRQGAGGLADTPEDGDWFGYSLAAGRTAAGESYLLIGVPGEDLSGGAVDAGTVHYVRGSVTLTITQDSADVPGSPENDDRFGYSVAGSPGHVAVGAPGEGLGSVVWAGTVDVFSHEVTGGTLRFAKELHQSISGVSDDNEDDDRFGTSVALAPFRPAGSAGGESLLAVGVPGEDTTVEGTLRADAGSVHRFRLTGDAFTELPRVTYESEDGDAFGERVLLMNTDPAAESTPQNLFLVVGTPGEDRVAGVDTGVVRVFSAAADPIGGPRTVERGSGLAGSPAAGELLGLNFGANSRYLFVASPYQARTVWAFAWTALAGGSVVPERTWQSGQGGMPPGGVSFGAATA